MEFITVEQFKEQPLEVQKVFLDWWKCDYGDLYYYNENPLKYKDFKIIDNDLECEVYGDFDYFKKTGVIPIFTEGQLRKFIEDKAECILDITVEDLIGNYRVYTVIGWRIKESENGAEFEEILIEEYAIENDLLQLYWRIACMVAKEGIV